MSSNAPERGPNGTLQRLLPLLVMGLTFLLLFQLFPQFFGAPPGAAPTPESGSALVTPVPTPAPDDSARTQYWNLVLVHPLEAGLRFFTNNLGLGAGTGIILFTVLVKVILLPLNIQQIRSQKAMQKLQPELKALQTKHKNDREKLGVETMALYKQHGVNPAAGCLPIVLQMPVLFGLYAALNNLGTQNIPENAAFQQPWLWVENLSKPDVINLPFLGFPLPFILPVLAAATQWVQQRMMTQPSDDPQQQMQQQIFQFMPLMMLWFGLSFSAGLAVYWVTQNVIGIIQQYFSTGFGALEPTVARLRGRAPTPPPAAVGGSASKSRRTNGAAVEGRRTRGKR